MTQRGSMAEDNPYIFGDPDTDRFRLETQSRLFSSYVRHHAREFCGDNVRSILDVGCGDGQLGFVLHEIYPAARLVGVDSDVKAIENAKRRVAQEGLSNIEFQVGSVEQSLPAGPFDLVYASAIFTHLHQPKQMIQMAYAALDPGGHFWVKDFDPDYFDDPTALQFLDGKFIAMLKLLLDTVVMIGGHPYCLRDLPGWMREAGFTNIRKEREYLRQGGSSEEGISTFAIGIGAFYNARALISKVRGIPDSELAQMYADVINLEVATKEESAGFSGNVVAEKPA